MCLHLLIKCIHINSTALLYIYSSPVIPHTNWKPPAVANRLTWLSKMWLKAAVSWFQTLTFQVSPHLFSFQMFPLLGSNTRRNSTRFRKLFRPLTRACNSIPSLSEFHIKTLINRSSIRQRDSAKKKRKIRSPRNGGRDSPGVSLFQSKLTHNSKTSSASSFSTVPTT